jgi:hypothetical protein
MSQVCQECRKCSCGAYLGATSSLWGVSASCTLSAVGFLSRRKRGYRAAFRVEKYRAAAEQLRTENPELYQQILSQADGSDAEEAARREPDAYVALFLAEAEDEGLIKPS